MSTNRKRKRKESRTASLDLVKLQILQSEDGALKSECTELAVITPTQELLMEPFAPHPEAIVEPNTNLFAAGHIVDPIEHMLDLKPVNTDKESEQTKVPCCENGSIDEETRFPESREIYLGLLGMLKRVRPEKDMPPNSQHCEHEMAEWFIKRRQAYRPEWGGMQAR